MMELVTKIKDVRHYDYLPEQQELGVLRTDGKMILYDQSFSVILKEYLKEAYDFFFAAKDKIVIGSIDKAILIQSSTNVHSSKYTIQPLEHNMSIPGNKFDGGWIFLTRVDGEKEYIQLNNNLEFERYLPSPLGIRGIRMIIDKETFISRGGTEMGLFSLLDGSEIWRIDTVRLLGSDDPRAVHDFISLNGKLYFYLEDNNKIDFQATFCLDARTGNVLERFDGFGAYLKLYKNKIYATRGRKISMLDITTHKIETLEFNDVLKAADLYINGPRCVVENEFLYFVDGMGRPKDRLAILNMETGQIVWHTKIKTTDTAAKCISKIHVHNGRLFVHASDNTLHIFDREGSVKKKSLMSFFLRN